MIRESGVVPQYSVFTPTTLQELLDGYATAMLAAGWTRTAGVGGGADQTFQSVMNPQGVQYRARLVINGLNLELYIRNTAETFTVGPVPVRAESATWRIIAGPWQVVAKQNTPQSQYGWSLFSALHIEAIEVNPVKSLVLLAGPGGWDQSWFEKTTDVRLSGWLMNGGVGAAMWGGTQIGTPQIPTLQSLANANAGKRFATGEYFILTPYVSLGIAGHFDTGVIVGTLWDAAAWQYPFPGDSVRQAPATEGGAVRNWLIVGNSNPQVSLGFRIP